VGKGAPLVQSIFDEEKRGNRWRDRGGEPNAKAWSRRSANFAIDCNFLSIPEKAREGDSAILRLDAPWKVPLVNLACSRAPAYLLFCKFHLFEHPD
jgi:hypothetical protein